MIHIVGNAALDTVIRIDRFPQPGETIVGRSIAEDLGGKGANQAIVIARCGQDVRLVAAVGTDAAGDRIRRKLAAEGVQTDGIRTWPGATDRCVIYVDNGGENTIVSLIDAASKFDPTAANGMEREVAPGDWVTLQGNLQASMTMACLALAKRSGATTALNPSPVYPAADYDWSLVDLVVLNRGEAVALGVRSDPVEAARALLAAGAIVWRSGKGKEMHDRDEDALFSAEDLLQRVAAHARDCWQFAHVPGSATSPARKITPSSSGVGKEASTPARDTQIAADRAARIRASVQARPAARAAMHHGAENIAGPGGVDGGGFRRLHLQGFARREKYRFLGAERQDNGFTAAPGSSRFTNARWPTLALTERRDSTVLSSRTMALSPSPSPMTSVRKPRLTWQSPPIASVVRRVCPSE